MSERLYFEQDTIEENELNCMIHEEYIGQIELDEIDEIYFFNPMKHFKKIYSEDLIKIANKIIELNNTLSKLKKVIEDE